MKFNDFKTDYEYCFVYGTLKSGYHNEDWLSNSEKIGTDITLNDHYEMVDLDGCPGVIPGDYHIAGEVWKVSPEDFIGLDTLEGYPTFYTRKKVKLHNFGHPTWMYILSESSQEGFGVEELRYHEENIVNVTTTNDIQYWSVPYVTEGKDHKDSKWKSKFEITWPGLLDQLNIEGAMPLSTLWTIVDLIGSQKQFNYIDLYDELNISNILETLKAWHDKYDPEHMDSASNEEFFGDVLLLIEDTMMDMFVDHFTEW